MTEYERPTTHRYSHELQVRYNFCTCKKQTTLDIQGRHNFRMDEPVFRDTMLVEAALHLS